jgi:cobalt-zinc-cadmium efflux system protein
MAHQARYGWLIAVTFFGCVVEAVGAGETGSYALLGDAMHALADVAPLAIGFLALSARFAIAQKKSLERATTWVNIVTLFVVGVFVGAKGGARLVDPIPVNGAAVFAFALVGSGANAMQLLFLHALKGIHQHDHAHRGQIFHVLSDLASNVAVVLAGAVIVTTAWRYTDALASLVVSVLTLFLAFDLLRKVWKE